MAGPTNNPYRFGGGVGYRRDGANRNYVRARNLDTQRGRWVSRDPIGFDKPDDNLYRYVHNKSVQQIDPNGLDPCPKWINTPNGSDILECMEDCLKEGMKIGKISEDADDDAGREFAVCMSKCLVKKGVAVNCNFIICRAFPAMLANGDPCDTTNGLQNNGEECCDVHFICDLLQGTGLKAALDKRRDCYMDHCTSDH
jgi:RHS repeat-associated protein